MPLAPQPTASGPVQLVYQDSRTEWFLPMVQEMLDQFHAAHPNIRVFYTPDPENLEDKMLADMQAVADAADSGEPVDPEVVRRVQERARKAREELVQTFGVREIGVDLIREARDAR